MDALITRRLDRLRVSSWPAGRAVAGRAPPDHAAALAAAVSGSVANQVVSVETSVDLPVDRLALGALPYPVGVDQPLVCLDLETTGLATAAGTLAFLVGIGIWVGDQFTVRQLVLPDHAAERSLLDQLADLLPADSWLVTYNGRSFDWPLLTARFRMHRRAPPAHAGHFDLLPVARQLWKHRLGGARLGLVETGICGIERDDDLPGYLIPERYFTYLRTRDAGLLRAVVEHNREDIVSMGRLLALLGHEVASPSHWPTTHPGDLLGLGRAYARRGRLSESLRAVEAGLRSDLWLRGLPGGAELHRRLAAERARLLARLGRRAEASAAWAEIALRGGPGAAEAWLHVASYREHVLRDLDEALDACRQALGVAERNRAWGRPQQAIERDLARRMARLRRISFRARSRLDAGRRAA